MTHSQSLSLNAPRITSQLPCFWTLTSLTGPVYRSAEIYVRVTGFTNVNNLIEDVQMYAGAAMVSNTKIWADPHLAGISVQKAELAALKKVIRDKKGH